eukprot:2921622-Pyramimonas_sp.AAC.1
MYERVGENSTEWPFVACLGIPTMGRKTSAAWPVDANSAHVRAVQQFAMHAPIAVVLRAPVVCSADVVDLGRLARRRGRGVAEWARRSGGPRVHHD